MIIENWSVVSREDMVRANSLPIPSEFSDFTAIKPIRLHGADRSGLTLTAQIESVEGEEVKTKTGSVYHLGKPNPEWIRWVIANEAYLVP